MVTTAGSDVIKKPYSQGVAQMNEYAEKNPGFIGSSEKFEEADIVIVGAPMECTVSGRPGTRQGPGQIRQVSHMLEEYSFVLGRELTDYNYYDAGDIVLPFGTVQESLRCIGLAVTEIFSRGKMPLVLGGEHLISLPVIREAAHKYPGLKVIHLDAHADLREEYLGEFLSHATVMRRVAEVIGSRSLYQFGIRSGTKDEFDFACANTNLFIDNVLAPLRENLTHLTGCPVYVTLDIDVVDPSFAPGTGTPEPGGISAREIIAAVRLFGELDVVGFDLVEVCPACDPSARTALLAAKLVREVILSCGPVKHDSDAV
jgi:agmatinase